MKSPLPPVATLLLVLWTLGQVVHQHQAEQQLEDLAVTNRPPPTRVGRKFSRRSRRPLLRRKQHTHAHHAQHHAPGEHRAFTHGRRRLPAQSKHSPKPGKLRGKQQQPLLRGIQDYVRSDGRKWYYFHELFGNPLTEDGEDYQEVMDDCLSSSWEHFVPKPVEAQPEAITEPAAPADDTPAPVAANDETTAPDIEVVTNDQGSTLLVPNGWRDKCRAEPDWCADWLTKMGEEGLLPAIIPGMTEPTLPASEMAAIQEECRDMGNNVEVCVRKKMADEMAEMIESSIVPELVSEIVQQRGGGGGNLEDQPGEDEEDITTDAGGDGGGLAPMTIALIVVGVIVILGAILLFGCCFCGGDGRRGGKNGGGGGGGDGLLKNSNRQSKKSKV